MKVSIVTASYNQGKYIKDCLDSVKEQTYRPIEHIIFDNYSTDETQHILEDYKKNSNGIEVKVFIEPDKGQSDALNKGFKLASGDIIGWLNADDYYLPNVIEKIIDAFLKYNEADVIYGNFYFVDEDKNILKKRKEIGFDYRIMLYYGCYIPTTATFFKSTLFVNNLFLNLDYHYLMDTEYFLRIYRLGYKFKHISDFVACFRWHSDNKSLNINKRLKEREKLQTQYGHQLLNNIEYKEIAYKIIARLYFIKRIFMKLIKGCYL